MTNSPLLAFLFLVLLAYSFIGLLAIWAGLGRPHWFLRMAVVGGVLSLGLLIPAYDLVLIFLIQSVFVIVPLLLIRNFLARPDAECLDGTSEVAPTIRSRSQFSLLDLLLVTAVVAALTAFAANVPANVWEVWRWNFLFPFFYLFGLFSGSMLDRSVWSAWLSFTARPAAPWIVFGLMVLFFVLSTLAAAWAALGRRCLPLRLIVLALIPTSMVMAAWLALMRASTHFGGKRRAEACVAKVALVLLSLLILTPLIGTYYIVMTPPPLPETVLPEPNGYDVLTRAGRTQANVTPFNANMATEAELGAFVDNNRETLDAVRAALDDEWWVPLEYSMSDIATNRRIVFRTWGAALHAEGAPAELEGRTADAVACYVDTIRLGCAGARGGLITDGLIGITLEGAGLYGLAHVRKDLTPEQSRDLLETLLAIEDNSTPLEEIFLREEVWSQHVLGWQGRLSNALNKLSDETDAIREVTRDFRQRKQAIMRLLIGELALQLYHAENGRDPEELADLVPDYLPAMPEDPFSGKPLVYRRTPTGRLLYSVNRNGVDDGGQPPPEYWDGDLLLDEPTESEED